MKKTALLVMFFCTKLLLAQNDTVWVYGPGGPFPAVNEVAKLFEKQNGVKVMITKGPLKKWENEAKKNADIIYSGSENMMSNFENVFKEEVVKESLYPLYYRKSGLIVRKNNPKNIKSLRDLPKPDVKIMVVNGAGLVGVWEDILGKIQNMEDFRKIRENIIYFAEDSGSAENYWKENKDIDVWITWNIWQKINAETSDFIALKEQYTIYRNCDIAFTRKGKGNIMAQKFYNFLKSKEAEIKFKQLGWQ